MSVFNDCRDCAKYQGNCGHHHVDHGNGHINYNIPAETWMDNVIGPHGSCFEPSQHYLDTLKTERVNYIIEHYSVQELENALEFINRKKETPQRPLNQKYISVNFETIGECPTCHALVSDVMGGSDERCKLCGQKLDWGG